MRAYERTHGSVVAVMEVPQEETGRYGVIATDTTRPRRSDACTA